MKSPRPFPLAHLPPPLRARLRALAQDYRVRGVDLFVFGSFARGDARPNSDLDLGLEWRTDPCPQLLRALQKEVDDLPTIRKIDLVDFSQSSPRWSSIAGRDRQFLFE